MNKKFLKHYMETEPEGTSKKYIFLVDNQDIAMNIVMSGYQALYLGQEDDEYYFSVNSFIGQSVGNMKHSFLKVIWSAQTLLKMLTISYWTVQK